MQNDSSLQSADDQGVDVTADSPLPDVPDAGDDSQPIVPPEPVDISTATLSTDASLVASTFGDPRTLYEQALDAYGESDGLADRAAARDAADQQSDDLADPAMTSARASRRARIYG